MKLVYVALGWVAGLLLVQASNNQATVIWVGLAGLAAISLWLVSGTGWRWAGAALLAFTLGGARATLLPETSPVATYNNSGGLTVVGQVIDEPHTQDAVTLARVRVQSIEQRGRTHTTSGLVLLRAPARVPLRYGDTVRATGRLAHPGTYDTFSYADYLARQNVYSILYNTAVEITATGGGNPTYRRILAIKQYAADAINQSLPEPQAGLLVGILLGDEAGLSDNLREDFAATGAAHIIAISGFNMVILAGMIRFFAAGVGLRGMRGGLVAIGVISLYTLLVGAGAAVVRAAVMSSLLVIGEALHRRTYVPASLALVAILLSALDPRILGSVSFQLSFFATLGLALFATPLTEQLRYALHTVLPPQAASTLQHLLTEPLVVTIAALTTTLPLTLLYFNQVSWVQLPVNLLIVPVQAAILLSGMLATLLYGIVPSLAQVLYWLCMALLSWSVNIVRGFADLPFATSTFYITATPIQLFFGIIIGGAMLQATHPEWIERGVRLVRSRLVLSVASLVAASMLWLGGALYTARPDGNLHVHMLDVGHSNGFLLETPGGAQILVDGGRAPAQLLTHIGDRLPFNDRHIELMMVTQPDPRLYGALPAVLARYDVGTILTNGQPNASEEFEVFQAAAAPYPTLAVKAGYRVQLEDGVQIEVLSPNATPTLADPLDDNALVLRVTYDAVSFLLTSDLSQAAQQDLLSRQPGLQSTVFQLPGHAGVRTLTPAFLAEVQPSLYVLHNDRANRRGDPNPDTLALLDETRPLYRTDQHQSVHLKTDGQRLWVAP